MTSAVGVSMDVERASGAAKRRRERRLRSWLRHERMSCPQPFVTAVMGGRFRALAYRQRRRTALGVDGGQESLRILGPPQLGVERAACPRSTGLPPLPDLCSGEVHNATLMKLLLRQTVLQRKKEEVEMVRESGGGGAREACAGDPPQGPC